MIHQPAGSFSEVATGEFILEVGELLKLRETLTRVYVQRTGKQGRTHDFEMGVAQIFSKFLHNLFLL